MAYHLKSFCIGLLCIRYCTITSSLLSLLPTRPTLLISCPWHKWHHIGCCDYLIHRAANGGGPKITGTHSHPHKLTCNYMPEGPSIVLLKEAAQQFAGQKIIAVSGDSKIDHSLLLNKKVLTFNSWGKHFLICLKDLTIRIHLLMFGSYRINEQNQGKQ